jgi:DNA-directed RNA polymerase subunit RPC12/RpoP
MAQENRYKLNLIKMKLRRTSPVETAGAMKISLPAALVSQAPERLSNNRELSDDAPVIALLSKCPDCSRSFNAESIEKHRKICKKVFKTRRKVFDVSQIRLAAIKEDAGVVISLKKSKGPTRPMQEKKSMSSWREKSAQFRAAMSSIRNGVVAPSMHSVSQYVCNHCGRGFNEEAGVRHEKICANIFAKAGGRLQKGGGGQAYTRKVDSTSLRLSTSSKHTIQLRR